MRPPRHRLGPVVSVALVVTAMLSLTAAARKPPAPAAPKPPAAKVTDVEAGPLFDDAEAKARCPTVCKAPLTWNGTWRTTKPTVMSVCGCAEPPPPPPPPQVREIEAGPLFNDGAAKATCPQLCKAPARWTGAWRTTKPGIMSVCSCEDPPPPPPAIWTVATGPIRSSADAKKKCVRACKAPLTWNGEWRSTKPGKAASCDCTEPLSPTTAPTKTPATTPATTPKP
jgi:Mannan-binding protein